MTEPQMNCTPALHWTANEPTQGLETDQGQKEAMVGLYENMGACDTHRIKCKCQGTKLRVYKYMFENKQKISLKVFIFDLRVE